MDNNRSTKLLTLGTVLVDFALITFAFFVAFELRFNDLKFIKLENFVGFYYWSAPLIVLCLAWIDGGVKPWRRSKTYQLRNIVYAFSVAGMVSASLLYFLQIADYSRLLFLTYFLFSCGFVMCGRLVVKWCAETIVTGGLFTTSVAVIGFGEKYDRIVDRVRTTPEGGVTAKILADPRTDGPDEIMGLVSGSGIDEVYISYPREAMESGELEEILRRLEETGMPIRLAFNYDDIRPYYSQTYCTLGLEPGVMLSPHNLDPDQLAIKRIFDVVGASLGVIILCIISPFVGIAVKLDSPGPVVFRQTRIGKNGRCFTLFKFRTMSNDAEARKDALKAHNMHRGALFKVDDDPRVTRVGRWLRKYSIDEVPQFINVLRGDMSLVGTRPPTPDEVSKYEPQHLRRISIKPGLTGLWQVSGRNNIVDFDEVVRLDVQYIRTWSIFLDCLIIMKTPFAIFGKGSRGR